MARRCDAAGAALDLGMRLERGKALVEITPERLLLRELADSEFAPLPAALKLDQNIDAASPPASQGGSKPAANWLSPPLRRAAMRV